MKGQRAFKRARALSENYFAWIQWQRANFSAVGCCVYIRHRQVLQWQTERGRDLVDRKIIVATMCCGILACFGLDILANFQEARVVAAHMVGAMTCFSAGTIYFCLQVRRSTGIFIYRPLTRSDFYPDPTPCSFLSLFEALFQFAFG